MTLFLSALYSYKFMNPNGKFELETNEHFKALVADALSHRHRGLAFFYATLDTRLFILPPVN